MFICQIGNHITQLGQKMVKVVVATRERTYRNMSGKSTYGWEVVREIKACKECAGKQNGKGDKK